MTPDLLRRVGESLYGPGRHWTELLAIDLAVAVRTCQRWASGQREIPDIGAELLALVHERTRELERLAAELDRALIEG